MEKVLVGTSGYDYFWNERKPTPFEWYLKQGFNSVEINVTFYRFPVSVWMETWKKAPKSFHFSIKVNRLITHYSRLGEKALKLWNKFYASFNEIDSSISFWLFQLPSSFKYKKENLIKLQYFFSAIQLGNSAIVEFRDKSWFANIEQVKDIGIGICSVDSPDFSRILVANDVLYLRLHGKYSWYNYVYSTKELDEIVNKVRRLKAKKKAIYLNNDHGMLENGIYIMRSLSKPKTH